MSLLSDKQIADNVRRRNREGVLRMRTRQREAGNVLLTGWVPSTAKDRVESLAASRGITMGEALALMINAYKVR